MSPNYRPEAEVTEICRHLIRIDTSNYGDDSGPGERVAAEYVAVSCPTSASNRCCSSRHRAVRRWWPTGGPQRRRRAAGARPPRRRTGRGHDWKVDPSQPKSWTAMYGDGGAVDMKDFDAAILSVVRARARAGEQPRRPITLAFTADEEAGSILGAHPLADQRRGGSKHAPRRSERSEVSRRPSRQAPVSGRDRREGHRLAPAPSAGNRWTRLHAKP